LLGSSGDLARLYHTARSAVDSSTNQRNRYCTFQTAKTIESEDDTSLKGCPIRQDKEWQSHLLASTKLMTDEETVFEREQILSSSDLPT
jgi:hypothetical protein